MTGPEIFLFCRYVFMDVISCLKNLLNVRITNDIVIFSSVSLLVLCLMNFMIDIYR